MKQYIVLILAFLGVLGMSWAADWEDALQMDIITREEWGADEVWRRASSFGIAVTPTPLGTKDQSIIDYLSAYFSSDLELDEVDEYEGGEKLWWPLEYKNDKKGIVIHHTVSLEERINEQGGVIPHLQQMYKFHTFTRGWGDIGYNFLIDQEGNIYEGRAGGTDVIGAHTRRNNNSTVGISLIGNFQEIYPSDAMMDSLTELSTALALYYGIDPNDDIIVHKETSTDPYVADVHTSAILGHRDAGTTNCPGDHVYALLPKLRKDVTAGLLSRELSVDVDAIHTDLFVQWIEGDSDDRQEMMLVADDTDVSGSVSCEWVVLDGVSVPLTISSCSVDGDELSIQVRVTGPFVPGPYLLLVDDGDHQEIRYVRAVRDTGLASLLEQRKSEWFSSLPEDPEPLQKITDHLTLDDARERADEDIRVLLHDVSIGTTSQTISCENRCMVTVEDASDSRASLSDEVVEYGTNESFSVVEFEGVLGMTIDGEDVYGSSLSVYDAGHGWVSLDMYARTSYAGVPRNRFSGTIFIMKDDFKNINTATRNREYVYINELSFHDYLLGLGEASVSDPIEKQKVLALLTKTYAMFYLSDNAHPSMDEEGHMVTYDAIDDPRAFQKYVGVGWLDVYPAWEDVVDDMWDVWATYDDYIPILPYFNCSAGFTRGAEERRGWTDTPWLESVVDFSYANCDEFAGHGVGLSGRGATYMAQHDVGYTDILQYYYSGIVIEE